MGVRASIAPEISPLNCGNAPNLVSAEKTCVLVHIFSSEGYRPAMLLGSWRYPPALFRFTRGSRFLS